MQQIASQKSIFFSEPSNKLFFHISITFPSGMTGNLVVTNLAYICYKNGVTLTDAKH